MLYYVEYLESINANEEEEEPENQLENPPTKLRAIAKSEIGKRKNSFRLRAKFILLTYSKVPASFRWENIIKVLDKYSIICSIGKERHRSNEIHYHAICTKYDTKDDQGNITRQSIQVRDPRQFDVDGFHPNILPIRKTYHKAWKYAIKDNNIMHHGIPEEPKQLQPKRVLKEQVLRRFLNQKHDSVDSFLTSYKDIKPGDYIKSFSNARLCAEYETRPYQHIEYQTPLNLELATADFPELAAWINDYMPVDTNSDPTDTCMGNTISDCPSLESRSSEPSAWEGSSVSGSSCQETCSIRYCSQPPEPEQALTNKPQRRPKSLILYGPTRLGKTLWARSMGRHCYFNNTFNLSAYDPNVRYAVFDDITDGLSKFPYKQWLGGQNQFEMTDKYHKKQTIYWNKPAIWIANENPLSHPKNIDCDWIKGNCVIVEIDHFLAWVPGLEHDEDMLNFAVSHPINI